MARPVDYYDEDVLNWLAADVVIRQQSNGAKTLDDFCKLFHGAPSGPPMVKTYNFEDILKALNEIVPYDWRDFWTQRLTNHGLGAPLDGIEGSGWKLEYNETPSGLDRARYREEERVGAHYTVGLILDNNGVVRDTVEGMVAAKAGIGPGMKVLAVNGRRFTPDIWHDAIRAAKSNTAPIELIIENTEYFRVVKAGLPRRREVSHIWCGMDQSRTC